MITATNIKSDRLENSNVSLESLLELLDRIKSPVYIADPDTHELLFANKALQVILGNDVTGEKCHKALQNLDKPCSFCTNHLLFGAHAVQEPLSWNHRNRINNRWYHCTDMAITWKDGRKVRIEVAEEISNPSSISKA